MHEQPTNGARSLVLHLKLRPTPYIVYANSEGSGESVRMHSRAGAWAVRLCIENRFHINGLISFPFDTVRKKGKFISLPFTLTCKIK